MSGVFRTFIWNNDENSKYNPDLQVTQKTVHENVFGKSLLSKQEGR